MRRLRSVAAVAVFTGALSLAGTGTAHAASCGGTLWYSYRPGGVTGLNGTKMEVSCDIAMTSLTVTPRLYRVDPVLGNVLVATATNTATNASYVSATAETACVPGLYHAEADYAGVWPNGSSFSRTYSHPQNALVTCT